MWLRAQRMPLKQQPRIRLKPRVKDIEYRMAYLGAKCEMSYQKLKRPSRDFWFGLVAHIPTHRINLS